MHPILHIFGLTINSYTFFFFMGCFVVTGGGYWWGVRRGFHPGKLAIVLVVTLLFGLIGARAFSVLLYSDTYLKNPSLIWNQDMQGQAVMGGLFLGFLSVVSLSKIFKLNSWKLLDTLAPFAGAGLIIGRIGCLLAGCCFGKETTLPIGITFPIFSEIHKYQLLSNPGQIFEVHPVHPTQVYEMFAGGIIIFLSLLLIQKQKTDGIAAIIASMFYIIFRLADEPLRAQVLSYSTPVWFYPSFYGVLFFILGGYLIKKILKI